MTKILLVLVIVGLLLFMAASRLNHTDNPSVPPPNNSEVLLPEPGSPITTELVAYYPNTTGFVAVPESPGNYPGIVMVHEWWGLNDNIKQMATKLAGQGYRVIAVDLFQGQVATNEAAALSLVGSLDQTNAIENLRAAALYLKTHGSVKVGTLGWCFGGGQALQLSLSGEPLNATVIYYGTPLITNRDRLTALKWPVLGIFGDEDAAIPLETVGNFEETLNELHIPNQIVVYPKVGHAFANPTGANFAPEATRYAWSKTLAFLTDTLKTE